MATTSQNGTEQQEERTPTERVILERSLALLVPDDLTNDELRAIAEALSGKRRIKPEVVEVWREVTRQTASSKKAAIELYAGKAGTPDAKVGTWRAPSLTAWKGGLEHTAPPKPLIEASVIE